MKIRILSIVIMVAFLINIVSTKSTAQETNSVEIGQIYKVVVPTSYSFTVDPYQVLDEDSMITSPEFAIINKSSMPIQVDASFRLTAKEGVVLDTKKSRNSVGGNTENNEIWLAAVFDSGINRLITIDKILTTNSGDIVYKYIDGDKVEYSTSPVLNLTKIGNKKKANSVNDKKEEQDEDDKNNIGQTEKPISVVSGSALEIENEVSGSGEPISTVSGSAVILGSDLISNNQYEMQIDESVNVATEEKMEREIESVSGAVLTIKK